MEKTFSTKKERIVIDIVPFTEKEFIETLVTYSPKEIFHSEWSTKQPFITITEYNNEGIKMYCNALSPEDRIPIQKTMLEFYEYMRHNSIQFLYINI